MFHFNDMKLMGPNKKFSLVSSSILQIKYDFVIYKTCAYLC